MTASMRIGVFLCPSTDPGAPAVDLELVARHASGLSQVERVRVLPAGVPPDPGALASELRAARLGAVVVAGPSPGFFKGAFARGLAEAGGDPGQVRLASFAAVGAAGGDPLERARAAVTCAVLGVPFGLAARPAEVPNHPATLVIGGGVAGIQAALEIAEAGFPVHLVERQPTIGGHMAMFDKTFPTLDCAACILTPKMVAVGQHPRIQLLVSSEVVEVAGHAGAFQVKVLRRASRVDPAACVACAECARFCPAVVPSEFDQGTGTRKAIYIPFPQAVPNTYTVDAAACTWVQSGGKKCGACAKKCAKNAIHLDARDETIELTVGNIVVATGYRAFDPRRIGRYGYGVLPGVLTGLEFERLTNASGPTGGKVVSRARRVNKRTKAEEWVFDPDGPAPRSVAIIHCVGSRDANHNAYCSRVCCMYSLKFAHLVREKLPAAEVHEFFIDMRAYGKGYEAFYERIREEGVTLVRGRPAKVFERGGQTFVRGEDVEGQQLLELPVDMVLLAVGLEPAPDAARLGDLLGIGRVAGGWFGELDHDGEPSATERGGVFVAGACLGPKDIPDTVAQASAVAGQVLRAIVSGRAQGGRGDLGQEEIERRARALAAPSREEPSWPSA